MFVVHISGFSIKLNKRRKKKKFFYSIKLFTNQYNPKIDERIAWINDVEILTFFWCCRSSLRDIILERIWWIVQYVNMPATLARQNAFQS
jgi:hypothetical protein